MSGAAADMQTLRAEVWDRGLGYEAYRRGVERNGEHFDQAYAEPAIEPGDLTLLEQLTPHRLLVLAADWCPDVFHTLPTWVRLVEKLPGWELRVFPLGEHPELMEPFERDGDARHVPVYAFYGPAGRLRVWWSGRCAAAERVVQEALGGRAYRDLDAEERAQVGRRVNGAYRSELRRRTLEEILTLLAAFYHLER